MSFDKNEERYHSYTHLRDAGVSWAEIGYGDSISADAARCWYNRYRREQPSQAIVDLMTNLSVLEEAAVVQSWTGQQFEEKKESSVAWREHFKLAEEQQRLKRGASGNNTFLKLDYSNDSELHFICLGDLHFFSGGTNHRAIEILTDRIISHPHLRVVLLGDILEMAINLRNVAEVTSQLAPPATQLKVLESWLNDIKDRVLFSTHDNHSSERLEKNAGVDIYGWLMSRVVPFFDGIGVCNIKVGSQEYRVGATHKTRGRSMLNPTHGQSRYMRFDDQSLDAMLAGDSHQPGISQYWDGDRERLAVNVGTMNVNSAFAKRYFSLYSQPIFPVVTLYGAQKEMNAFRSLESWSLAHGNK
jgi:hypothetical protein